MLKNVVKTLTNNLGLKVLALLFSVIMWMAVVNLNDPEKNRTFTIPIAVENENAIARLDKYYEIESDSTNVTFNVSGKRSVIDALSNSDFKATADMTQLVQGEKENVVPIEITALRYANQLSISKRTKEIKVLLEDLRRETFDIQANTQGGPAEGYALGSMEVMPNRLRISGPKDVVSQIQSVKAFIDVTDISTDITDSVVPVLLDKDGERVDQTKLTLNLNTVTVKVEIVSEKTVPIRVSYSGEPADGYEVISVKAKPEEVTIKGKSDILNGISSISVPEEDIRVDGADAIINQQMDISQYLPEGVALSNSTDAKIVVTVDVEKLERRTFSVPVKNIGIDNLPEGSRIDFNERNVDIAIYGLTDDLNALSVNEIRPVLDVSGLMPGKHVRQLRLTLDDTKYVVGDTEISFTISSIGRDDTQADNDTPQGGTETGNGGDGDSGQQGGNSGEEDSQEPPEDGTQAGDDPQDGQEDSQQEDNGGRSVGENEESSSSGPAQD